MRLIYGEDTQREEVVQAEVQTTCRDLTARVDRDGDVHVIFPWSMTDSMNVPVHDGERKSPVIGAPEFQQWAEEVIEVIRKVNPSRL